MCEQPGGAAGDDGTARLVLAHAAKSLRGRLMTDNEWAWGAMASLAALIGGLTLIFLLRLGLGYLN